MCTGTCSHSICEICYDQKRTSTCSICDRENAFLVKNINYDAMKILEELHESMSMKRIAYKGFNKESLAKGRCSVCDEHCNKLRLCVDCSVASGLLVKSEDGVVKVTTNTSGELLEAKILRIRSSAFCADCLINEKLHEGHSTMFVKDIKNLADTTEILNAMSVVSLSLNNIKKMTEDFDKYRTPMRLMHTSNQCMEASWNALKDIKGNTPCENGLVIITKVMANMAGHYGKSSFFEKALQKLDEKLEEAESSEERVELQMTKEQILKFQEHSESLEKAGKLNGEDFQFLSDLLKPGTIESIFDEFKSDPGNESQSSMMQDVVNISKDFKNTIPFKIPLAYEKYADLAESFSNSPPFFQQPPKMSMLSSAFCLKCVKMFDLNSRKMCTGKCMHSICESCFDKKLSNSCPTCETADAFEVKNINYQAQEMLSEFMKSFSIDDKLKGIESRNIGEGACSECRKPSERLRVCSDCTTRSGLLSRDRDGHLRLSTETANELLETKILKIRSVAICADCALDGKKHQGHKLVIATDIENMENIVAALDLFSAVTFISQKIKEEAKDCKQMKDVVTLCSLMAETMKFSESFFEFTGESRNNDSILTGFNSLVRVCRNCIAGVAQPLVKQALYDEIQEAKNITKKTENEKEKKEWETIIQKLEYYEQLFSKDTSFDWKLNALEAIKLYESGALKELMNLVTDRELPRVTKDVRRTMKLPKEVEKYVNVAGSVLQFFLGNEEKKEEELDLD